MGRKIFISYKHNDSDVKSFDGQECSTARSYVGFLIEKTLKGEIYKGEGDEDLSDFRDDTIETHLKNKIFDSSITIVLISPNMKEIGKKESDQWIPWEISYSLRKISKKNSTSSVNAVLAVALPNLLGSYEYFISHKCSKCNARFLDTDKLFEILKYNMFNVNEPEYSNCDGEHNSKVYVGECSYIISVKWAEFIENPQDYLERAENIRKNIEKYKMKKKIQHEL